jgi:ribonuclease HI
MTPHEAEYDILITALRSLKRQGSVSHLSLIIKSSSKLVVNQLSGQWKVSAPSLSTRRERVFDLLNEAADYSIQLVPRTAIEHLLTR